MVQINRITYYVGLNYCTWDRLPEDNGWAVNVVVWNNGKKKLVSDVTKRRPNQERAYDYIQKTKLL